MELNYCYLFEQELKKRNAVAGPKIWSDQIKPKLRKLILMEEILQKYNSIKSPLICKRCEVAALSFTRSEHDQMENTNVHWICEYCDEAEPIFVIKPKEVGILIELIDKADPQLIATALNAIFISANIAQSLSPQITHINPIHILRSMYQASSSALKFGGTNAVIIANIYENPKNKQFPILYIADTMTIPTRYYLHTLKGLSADRNETQSDIILNELIAVANNVINANSFLVLGSKLQNLISHIAYQSRVSNLLTIITLDELKQLDNKTNYLYTVTENFDKISLGAKNMCTLASGLTYDENPNTPDEYYKTIQTFLIMSNWLRVFCGTPFEVFLYHWTSN